MALPLSVLSPVSPILSGMAIGAIQDLKGLVFPRLPSVSVAPQAYKGQIFAESSQSFMGDSRSLKTALSQQYPTRTMGNPSITQYVCQEYKIAGNLIPTKLSERSQFPTPLEVRDALQLACALAIDVEKEAAAAIFNTSNWGHTDLVSLGGGGVQWTTWATAKPDNDLQKLKVAAREAAYGRNPNTLIMGQSCLDNYVLCLQAQGVALVTSGAAPGQVITEEFAIERIKRIFGFEQVLIGSIRSQTSAPGASATSDYVWGDYLWAGLLDNAGNMVDGNNVYMRPNAVLLVKEQGDAAGMGVDVSGATLPVAITQSPVIPPNGDGIIVAGRAYVAFANPESNLGYLVTDVLA